MSSLLRRGLMARTSSGGTARGAAPSPSSAESRGTTSGPVDLRSGKAGRTGDGACSVVGGGGGVGCVVCVAAWAGASGLGLVEEAVESERSERVVWRGEGASSAIFCVVGCWGEREVFREWEEGVPWLVKWWWVMMGGVMASAKSNVPRSRLRLVVSSSDRARSNQTSALQLDRLSCRVHNYRREARKEKGPQEEQEAGEASPIRIHLDRFSARLSRGSPRSNSVTSYPALAAEFALDRCVAPLPTSR
jgi:hypothetical protein